MNKWVIVGIVLSLVIGIIVGGYYLLQDSQLNIITKEQLQDVLDEIPQSINNINRNLEDAEKDSSVLK